MVGRTLELNLLAIWVVLVLASGAGSARAQNASSPATLPTAVLFSTASSKINAAPLDSVLHASVEKLGVVKVAGRPGMDLAAVQLAIDCVSETPPCLRAVGRQTNAEVLIAPSLQSTPSEIVLSILRFDTADAQLRRVVRRQPGSTLKSETLDGVPSMLRELFELPEPPPPAAAEPLPTEPPADEPTPWRSEVVEPPQDPEDVLRPMPIGPWIVAGAGVVAIGGGVLFGSLMASNQDEYNSRTVRNRDDIDELLELRDTAETQATVANILFGVGGAAIVAGGIWLAVALSQPARSETDWQTIVVPSVGPKQLGLSVRFRGGSL